MDSLQILAEPKRRRILAMVWSNELPASAIASEFDVTFGAISQHLAVLKEADFVRVRKDGNRRYYMANRVTLEPYREVLETMWGEALGRLARLAESKEVDDG